MVVEQGGPGASLFCSTHDDAVQQCSVSVVLRTTGICFGREPPPTLAFMLLLIGAQLLVQLDRLVESVREEAAGGTAASAGE